MGLQDVYKTAVEQDPYAGFGQKIKSGYNTAGGWFGKNSVATRVGNFVGYHPFRKNDNQNKIANEPQQQQQQEQQSSQNDNQNLSDVADSAKTVIGSQSGGSVSGWSAEEDKKRQQEERFKSNLGKAYKGYGKSLSKLAGFIPEEESRLVKGIEDLFTGYKGTAEKETKSALDEQGKYRDETQEDQRKTLGDLAEATRKDFMSGNALLGSRGASDSSAAGMYATALTQEANKSRGQILEQAKKIYSEITGREKAIQETHDLELGNMERWIGDKKSAIKDAFKRSREAIMDEMDSADDNKRNDLERLDQQNLNKAYQRLYELENQAYQYRNELSGWKESVMGSISDMKKSIIERGSFKAEELETPDADNALNFNQEETYEDFYDPAAPKRKKAMKGFLDNPLTEEDMEFEY